jgi:hypothetical protein
MLFCFNTIALLSAFLASATTLQSNQPTPTTSSFASVPNISITAPKAIPTHAAYESATDLEWNYAGPAASIKVSSASFHSQDREERVHISHHRYSTENVIFTSVAGLALILLNSFFSI